jgi:hypothetical protein
MQHAEIEQLLRMEGEQAKSLYEIAKAEFVRVSTDIPSGLPSPDSAQRIHNPARDQRAARNAFQAALDRFNDFVLRGKIPDALMQDGPQ